jgi:hypothetical protein
MADVICRGCGGRYHETTEKFDGLAMANGSMFRLKPLYQGHGWSSFPEHAGMTDGDLECPQCGAPYCVGGRVRLGEDVCAICGKIAEDGTHACREQETEMDRLFAEYNPEPPAPTRNGVLAPQDVDEQIKALNEQGKKPGEIAAALGLGHYMHVVNRLKAMGIRK